MLDASQIRDANDPCMRYEKHSLIMGLAGCHINERVRKRPAEGSTLADFGPVQPDSFSEMDN